MTTRRYCTGFGILTFNGNSNAKRKSGDVCVNSKHAGKWGKPSSNVLKKLGQDLYPISCEVL